MEGTVLHHCFVFTFRSPHAFQPVLIKRVYLESLGILVNAVLLRVLVEIENQEDISEESSHRLNDLCKMLHELESLFQDGEEVSASQAPLKRMASANNFSRLQSTIALHVPVWFKFKFLSELLEASMVRLCKNDTFSSPVLNCRAYAAA